MKEFHRTVQEAQEARNIAFKGILDKMAMQMRYDSAGHVLIDNKSVMFIKGSALGKTTELTADQMKSFGPLICVDIDSITEDREIVLKHPQNVGKSSSIIPFLPFLPFATPKDPNEQ